MKDHPHSPSIFPSRRFHIQSTSGDSDTTGSWLAIRRFGAFLQPAHDFHELFGKGRVEMGGGLIRNDHRGLLISARAMATRCISPPESLSTWESDLEEMLKRSRSPWPFSSGSKISPRGIGRYHHVLQGGDPWIRLYCWKMNPKVFRRISVRNLSGKLVISLSKDGSARGRPGHASDQAQEGRLPRSAGP